MDGAGGISRPALAGIVFATRPSCAGSRTCCTRSCATPSPRGSTASRSARPRPALIVVEVPLLFETGFDQRFDHIMLITAPDEVRRRRVTAKLTDSEFRRRRAQQMPEDEKVARSDFVFDNSGSRKELQGVRGADRGERSSPETSGRGGRRRRDASREAPLHRPRPGGGRAGGRVRGRALGGAAVRQRERPLLVHQDGRTRSSTPAPSAPARARYDLDPALVAAVVYAESKFDEHALSSQGAVGLMQILPETAHQIADESGGVDVHHRRPGGPAHQRALRVLLPAPGARRLRRRPARGRGVVQRRHGRGRTSGSRRRTPTVTSSGSATSRIPRHAPTSRRCSRLAGYTGKSTASASGGRRTALSSARPCERVFVLVAVEGA